MKKIQNIKKSEKVNKPKDIKKIIEKSIIISFLSIFGFFGCIFFAGMVHELVHVVQSDGHASSVCVAFGLYLNDSVQSGYLNYYTTFDGYPNLEEFTTFREYSEKYAQVFQEVVEIIIGFLLCYFILLVKSIFDKKAEEN